MLRKKVCLVGAFAVGKTSLAARFVHSIYSEKYHTTIGVKIDTKELVVDGEELTLVIWDLAGEDEFLRVKPSFLRGSAGYILVVDGTRPTTLETAAALQERIRTSVGPLPHIILANKFDLKNEWRVKEEELRQLCGERPLFMTSAKEGTEVEEAFMTLANLITRAEA